jgi:tetratricopeptide (TPR) repeat protein
MRILTVSWVVSLCFLIVGCSASSGLFKEGQEHEKANRIEEAMKSYQAALAEDSENQEALDGLKRTAQSILKQKAAVLREMSISKNWEGVLRLYVDMQTFSNSLGNTTRLVWPREYDDLNNSAKKAIKEEEYVRGMDAYNASRWREAYKHFTRVEEIDASYKNTYTLKKQSVEKGSIAVGFFPFRNATNAIGAEQQVYAFLLRSISKKDPFVKVIDRESLEKLLNEQKLSVSGIVDEKTAINAGKIIGLKTFIMARLVTADIDQGSDEIGRKSVFHVTSYTQGGKTYYNSSPVELIIMKEWSTANYAIEYEVISSETGQITHSDVVSDKAEDRVEYIDYRGNASELHESEPPNDQGLGDVAWEIAPTRFSDGRLGRKKPVKRPSELSRAVVEQLADKIAGDLLNYIENNM